MKIILPCKTKIIDLKNCGDIYIKKVDEKFGIYFELDENRTDIALYQTEKQAKFIFNKIASLLMEDILLELPSEENLFHYVNYEKENNGKIQTVRIGEEIFPVETGEYFPCGEFILGYWWWENISEFRDLYKEKQPWNVKTPYYKKIIRKREN